MLIQYKMLTQALTLESKISLMTKTIEIKGIIGKNDARSGFIVINIRTERILRSHLAQPLLLETNKLRFLEK